MSIGIIFSTWVLRSFPPSVCGRASSETEASVFGVLALCHVMSPQPWDVFRGSGGEWTAVSRHPRVDVKRLRQGNVFVYEYKLRPGQCVYWCYEVYLCFAVLKVFLTGTNYSVFVQACMCVIALRQTIERGVLSSHHLSRSWVCLSK